MCLIESKSLLVLEHSCDTRLAWAKHEVVTLTIFMKIYSLMPLDAFNGSLVEKMPYPGCRIYISDTFTHSRKREGKITKMVSVGCHRSDWWQAPVWPVSMQQVHLGGWPGTSARVTRYASVCCRMTRHECPGDPGLSKPSRRRVIWRRRLWEAKHISINKSFMCCDQVWNEPHRVLNWTKCLDREIQNL
jgi:hypothetical protein